MLMASGAVTENGAPAVSGQRLDLPSSLLAQKDGMAIITCNDTLLRLHSGAAAGVTSDGAVTVDAGMVSVRGAATVALGEIRVSSRAAVFAAERTGAGVHIFVTEGRVRVKGEGIAETELAAGRALVIAGKGPAALREISLAESLELSRIASVTLPASPPLSGDELRIIAENDARIDREIAKLASHVRAVGLDEIRAQFGRIDTVTLYTGKPYRGAIVSRGKNLWMVTPSGLVVLANSQVKLTEAE